MPVTMTPSSTNRGPSVDQISKLLGLTAVVVGECHTETSGPVGFDEHGRSGGTHMRCYRGIMRWVRWLGFLGLCGCGMCGGDIEVDGEHPYHRCALADPTSEEHWEHGDVVVTRTERALSIGGTTSFLAYSLGSGPQPDLPEETLHIVMGGVASGLEQLQAPLALLLPGGGDSLAAFEAALDALPDEERARRIDLRGIHSIGLSDVDFVVVAGAPGGRYAVGEDACAFDEAALEVIGASELGPSRGLLSWAVPAGRRVDLGFEGALVGDTALGELMDDMELQAGIYAWPRTSALEPVGTPDASAGHWTRDLQIVVPGMGFVIERADESRVAPAAIRVETGPEGLKWSLI